VITEPELIDHADYASDHIIDREQRAEPVSEQQVNMRNSILVEG
jgi:hypothetical protein